MNQEDQALEHFTPNQIQNEFARRDLLQYRRLVSPKLKMGWFHREVCYALEDFYEQLISGQKPVLILQAPPQHGKSRAIIDFISWVSGKNPDLETFYTAFSDRLGVRANLRLQRTYDSEIYKQIFPELKISSHGDKDSHGFTRNRNLLEYVGRDGLFRNTTVNGAITGETIGLGIIDDPMKGRKEANSVTIRDTAWDWLTDDFFTRFEENAGLLMMLTRWHLDDPAGRLILEMPGVRVLNFPAIAEKGIEDAGVKHRKIGEPLFPEHKSLEFLMKRKALMTNHNWLSLYQGCPIQVGGGLIKVENFKITPVCPEGLVEQVRYWDKAGTEGGGAFTAGVKVGRLEDGRFIVLDVISGQWSAMRRERRILQTAQIDKISVQIGVEQEPGSGGMESAENTIRMLAGYNCYADKVTDSKDVRAEPFAAQVEAGNILLLQAEWNKEFIAESETFPDGKFKDMVDAAVGAFQKLSGVPDLGFSEADMNEIKNDTKSTTSPGIGEKVW
ncbi:MAG: phage terminase large subunit [Candidatus Anammoxibacter sp.]